VAATRRLGAAAVRPLCRSEIFVSGCYSADYPSYFGNQYLPNYDDLVHGVVYKVGDLSEGYNFVNWSLSLFGLVSEIQSSKHRCMKLEFQFILRNVLSLQTIPKTDLWALFEHVMHIFMRWS
jgi:hypothetical protein